MRLQLLSESEVVLKEHRPEQYTTDTERLFAAAVEVVRQYVLHGGDTIDGTLGAISENLALPTSPSTADGIRDRWSAMWAIVGVIGQDDRKVAQQLCEVTDRVVGVIAGAGFNIEHLTFETETVQSAMEIGYLLALQDIRELK